MWVESSYIDEYSISNQNLATRKERQEFFTSACAYVTAVYVCARVSVWVCVYTSNKKLSSMLFIFSANASKFA